VKCEGVHQHLVLAPKLGLFAHAYSDVVLDVTIDDRREDLVAAVILAEQNEAEAQNHAADEVTSHVTSQSVELTSDENEIVM
jgi:hypothetical protein